MSRQIHSIHRQSPAFWFMTSNLQLSCFHLIPQYSNSKVILRAKTVSWEHSTLFLLVCWLTLSNRSVSLHLSSHSFLSALLLSSYRRIKKNVYIDKMANTSHPLVIPWFIEESIPLCSPNYNNLKMRHLSFKTSIFNSQGLNLPLAKLVALPESPPSSWSFSALSLK